MPPSSAAPPDAEPVLRGSKGNVYAVSSFGVDFTTFGPDFSPGEHFDSERFRVLSFRESFSNSTRHDGKVYDWQGCVTAPGRYEITQPLIGSSVPSTYVPLDIRRPSNPYRLAKLINRSFTALVFGEERFPSFDSDDPDTKDFANALLEASKANVKFVQARNRGGGCGTVGMSWRFVDGEPRLRVHAGKLLLVHAWIDREAWLPEHVTEISTFLRTEWDPKKKQKVERPYYARRDWTPTADVQFVEARADLEHVTWIVNEAETFLHDDGFPHFVWIRNGGDDDDGVEIDGAPDFDGQYSSLDQIDVLRSILNKGAIKNLDPTLILKLGLLESAKAKNGVEKGSGNSINVGENGSASYLELAGTSTKAGADLLMQERDFELEQAQCVVPSHAELSAAGTSSVAQKMLFAPMLGAASIQRTVYGTAMVQLFEQMLESARHRYPTQGEDGEPVFALIEKAKPELEVEHDGDDDADDDEVEQVDFFLRLPPKVVNEPITDENGIPTGEARQTTKELTPGAGRITIVWPPYFAPTALDVQQLAQSIAAAAGGRPALSQQTAVEMMAKQLGVDPVVEWQRVLEEQRMAAQNEAAMFPGNAQAPSRASTGPTEPEVLTLPPGGESAPTGQPAPAEGQTNGVAG